MLICEICAICGYMHFLFLSSSPGTRLVSQVGFPSRILLWLFLPLRGHLDSILFDHKKRKKARKRITGGVHLATGESPWRLAHL
jgi:hypothetical protein